MAKKIEISANYKARLNGITIGETEKISAPKIVQTKVAHTSAAGDYEIATGHVEKMEASCVVYSENFIHYFASGQMNDAELDFTEALNYGAETREGNFEFKGVLDIDVADSERKGIKKVTLTMSCNRAYHEIDGVPVYHIDFENNINMRGGIDTMEKTRQIIGG